MVLGMDPAIWTAIAPALTIWSGRERPNTEHAQPLALAAIPGLASRGGASHPRHPCPCQWRRARGWQR